MLRRGNSQFAGRVTEGAERIAEKLVARAAAENKPVIAAVNRCTTQKQEQN